MNRSAIALALAGLFLTGCARETGPRPYRIYVTNEVSGDLSVIDSVKMETIATIPLGKRPRGIVSSPDGKTIYVALSGSPIGGPGVDESTLPPPDKNADGIGVFDVQQNKLLRLIKSGSDPENFDLSKDGKLLYVSNEDAGGASVLDLATEKVLASFETGDEPEGVRMSPDGKFVWVTSEAAGTVAVIDTAARKVVHTIKVGRRPRSIAFMPDSASAWVNAENDGTVSLVDAVKHEVTATIELGKAGVIKPMGLLLSHDARKLYVSTGRGHQLAIIDTATQKVDAMIEVGQRPWGLGQSPDGKTVFTANGPSNDLSVIDLATKTVTKKIKLTGSPWGVLILQP